jgi:hypothetical protein
VGFGWAPLGLTSGGGLDVQLGVLLVTLCVATGSIPAFSNRGKFPGQLSLVRGG